MEESKSSYQNSSNNAGLNYETIRKQREEYFSQLRTWLDNARLWQNVSAGFPYYYAGVVQNENGNSSQQQNEEHHNHSTYISLVHAHIWHQNMVQNIMRQRFNTGNRITFPNLPFYQTYPFNVPASVIHPPRQRPSTYEFIIPPLWKRLVAEIIDFMILFAVKLALTFLLMESFDFINLDFYGFDSFQKNLENPEVAYPMALELLTLEVLHRLIVCAYETYFLGGRLGATPGKRYMGLMVIKVDSLSLIPGRRVETVIAVGARPLGWQKALVRSTLKNLFVGLLVPLFITFYIFPYNRTSYDMMAHTIVVESHLGFLTMHDYHEAAPEA